MENTETKFLEVNRGDGLIVQVSDLVERAISNVFGALADINAEVRSVIGPTLDYGETVGKTVLRLGRKLGERALDFGAEVTQRSERATRGVVQAVRATGSEVIDAAAQALVSTSPAKAPAAQSRAKA